MATAKTTKRRRNAPRPADGELPEEFQLRRLMAKQALKEAKAMLATYAGADRGRRNKDWKASAASADQAIIPDSPVLNARTRQMVRDNSTAKSAVRAFVRNVVKCGIIPIPMARDAAGKLLTDLNKLMLKAFWEWANDANLCDLEGRQTFWQKQSLCESERVTVGGAMVIWSYDPRRLPNGQIDKRWPIGLKLQSAEYEQLDRTILSYEGREVRGGVEVDEYGKALAYHLYKRNPNDYSGAWGLQSERVPASRVFHYFRQERVRQTIGVSELAPVLQDIRDLGRGKEASLWRMIMEACVGMIITRQTPTSGSGRLGLPGAPGDSNTTASGMRKMDFVPGMVPELLPGEGVEPYVPSSPGNGYAPFTKDIRRQVGAGIGISYGQLARQSEGNYSAARQDMLEDRNEFEPLQEMLAHGFVLPVWRLFVMLSVAEGRFEIPDFEKAPMRAMAAEFVAPAQPWIDPLKEINALCKAVDYKLRTRESIIALQGERREDVWDGIAAEQKEAESLGIKLPENKETSPVPQPKPGQLPGKPKDNPKADVGPEKPKSGRSLAMLPPEVPQYKAAVDPLISCTTCKYFDAEALECRAYDFPTQPTMHCYAWETVPLGEGGPVRRSEAPGVQDGERPMDDPRGGYLDRGHERE